MKKLTLLLVFISVVAKGQINISSNDSFISLDQKLIKMAVDSSICIIRQDYILKGSKNNPYGRANKDYFGRMFQLGVITENNIWVDKKIATPWLFDINYDSYKANDTLKPELSDIAVKFLPSNIYKQSNYKIQIIDSSSIFGIYHLDSIVAFPNVKDTRDGNGWLVVVHSKEELIINEKSPIEYTIYNPNLTFVDDKSDAILKKMPVKGPIIGGIYYTFQLRSGKIQFYVAGILKKKGTEWMVEKLTSKEQVLHEELTIIKNPKDSNSTKKENENNNKDRKDKLKKEDKRNNR